MKNCLILGSGRSGTSLLAAMLSKSDYFMGHCLSQERESNAITNFEDIEVNRVNELLLAQVVPKRPRLTGNLFFSHRPSQWQRWLAKVPLGTYIHPDPTATKVIRKLVKKEPYCFKDPRLSYTLPVWKTYLNNTVYICVFRHPDTTAQSILKLCNKASYLKNFSIRYKQALEVWKLMYCHILAQKDDGKWLFIHYEQLFCENNQKDLADFTGAALDNNVVDHKFRQQQSVASLPNEIKSIYSNLCELANYQDV